MSARLRADRPEVRNPVLGLPAFKALAAQPAEARALQAALYYSLAAEAREKSGDSMTRNKPWMFVYWRCIATYARHTARALMAPTTT